MEVICYTDGSAVVNGKHAGRGGFGVYFPDFFGEKKGIGKGVKQGKTGEMEVTALLYAIKAFDNIDIEINLKVYSDSQYVVKTISEGRLWRWAKDDFEGKANSHLWRGILKELEEKANLKLELHHIKSHQFEDEKLRVIAGKARMDPHILGNEMADNIANYKNYI